MVCATGADNFFFCGLYDLKPHFNRQLTSAWPISVRVIYASGIYTAPACMNVLINIEMHHKMIVATPTDQRRSAPWRRGVLRLDASLSGEPVAGALGVEQTIRWRTFLYWYVADGVAILMK